MSSPLTFLRPLRYDRVRDVLLVQTGDAALLERITGELRGLFPGCAVKLVVREADAGGARSLAVDELEVARWEERYELLARLRRRRFDVVVLQLAGAATTELRLLPFLLRTRHLIAFNDRLDYFPVNVFRLTDVTRHFSGGDGEVGLARSSFWLVRRTVGAVVLGVLGFVHLLASVGWLHLRGWLRRRRRAPSPHAAARAGARVA
ncbi:MAG: hypothetical protein AB1689_12625 [Thermodesulfobacteriota bacterium]